MNIQKGVFEENQNKCTVLTGAIGSINYQYGVYTISPAQLFKKTSTNEVIVPAWKPDGWGESV